VAGGILVGAMLLVITRWPVAAVCATALIVAWPQFWGAARTERAQIARLEQLVVWTETLRDTTSAHIGLEQAIAASATSAPPLIRPALVRLIGLVRARVPLETGLLRLAADLDDPRSADPIIATLILYVRRRGDRVADVLAGLAHSARQELDQRRQIVAGRAELRRGVQIIVIVTVSVALYMAVFNHAFAAPYATVPGQVALLVVIAMFGTGFALLHRAARSDPITPFLPRRDQRLDVDTLRLVARLTGTEDPPGALGRASARSNGRRLS
jgi:Flp pilus assembly protein TadB